MFYDKWAEKQNNAESKKRLGVLLATGLIVGESLFGVLNAGIIAASAGDSPLEIFSGGMVANILGIVLLVVMVGALYRWVARLASKA